MNSVLISESEVYMRVKTVLKLDPLSKARLPMFTCPISAGQPVHTEDYRDNDFDAYLLTRHPYDTFILPVEGDSMIDAHICSGDWLVVDRAIEPSDGSIVIASINDELTVKRLRKRSGRITLKPENDDYRPLHIAKDMELTIWGVVVKVIHDVEI
jgi:DNA polymerase V